MGDITLCGSQITEHRKISLCKILDHFSACHEMLDFLSGLHIQFSFIACTYRLIVHVPKYVSSLVSSCVYFFLHSMHQFNMVRKANILLHCMLINYGLEIIMSECQINYCTSAWYIAVYTKLTATMRLNCKS